MQKADIEAALSNWALWRVGDGAWAQIRSAQDLDMDRPDVRVDRTPAPREARIPVLSGLATDVDNIINAMQIEWAQALRAYYLGVAPDGSRITIETMENAAKRWLACSVDTYQRRLAAGRQAVGDALDARNRRLLEAQSIVRRSVMEWSDMLAL